MHKFLNTMAVLALAAGALGVGSGTAQAAPDRISDLRAGPALPAAPEAAGDDISFAYPNAVLRTVDRNEFSAAGLAAGDFNGDGKLDLATVGGRRTERDSNLDYLYVMAGNGDGTFHGAVAYPAITELAAPLAVDLICPIAKDFDGDSKLDILVAASNSSQVMFFKGRGDGSFALPRASTFPAKPNCLRVAELNGDGKLDAISWNYDGSKVMVAFGTGNGTFTNTIAYTAHGNVNNVLVGDVNKDGKLDLVYSPYDNPKFGVMLNDGSGGFSAAPLQVGIGGGNVTDLSLADYSGDGKLDVLAGRFGNVSGSTYWSAVLVRGNGNGTFQTPTGASYINHLIIVPTTVNYSMADAPDLNSDGKPDLVIGSGTQEGNALMMALNDGAGNFGSRRKWVASAGSSSSTLRPDTAPLNAFLLADFNGDGKPDMATSYGFANGSKGGHVDVMLGKGNGLFESSQMMEESYEGRLVHPRTHALQDFNGDGKLDLVTVSNGYVVVQAGNGDGTLASSGLTSAPTPASSGHELVIGDIDGDGDLDAVYGTGGVYGEITGHVTVASNSGNGTVSYKTFRTAASARDLVYQSQTLGDFNGDGKLDIAIKQIDRIEVMLHPFPTGDNSTPNATLTISPGDLTPNSSGHYPLNTVHAADLDGDGKVDLLAHSRNGAADNLEFFKGNGNGTFAAAVSVGSGYGDISTMLTRDVDGDGKLDLVAAGAYAIWVAKGVGDGTFFPPTTIGVDGGSDQMAVTDFNGDGKLDIATTYLRGVAVHAGKGGGAFGPATFLARGNANFDSGLTVGDLNGDGKPDLVSHRRTTGSDRFYETVLLNTSGPQANLKMSLVPSRLVVLVNTPSYFIATITNTGSSTATNVSLRSLLPATSWSVDAVTASQGSCSSTAGGSGVVSCVIGSMAFSTTQVVTITARPLVTGALAATASVSSTLFDSDLSDNGGGASIVASPPAPPFVVEATASSASGSAGPNANGTPVIIMSENNVKPVPISVRIDKSKLPNGIPNTSQVRVGVIYRGVTYTMVETIINVNISVWTVTIPPDVIVLGPEDVIIRVWIPYVDVDHETGELVVDWVLTRIQLIDPSGIVSDRATGKPIVGATVTLYKVPGAMPDEGGVTKQCRTINTRPGGAGGNWDSLPPANLASGVLPNLFFDPGEISPVVNPQTTSSEGRYAWDVVKGCWFIKVEAAGYKTVISPLVGVPPEVKDLNIKMDRQGVKVFLPFLRKP